MFSQVPQTSAIPENPFHFRIILEGVFGFFGSLPFFGFLALLYFSCVGQEQDLEYDHTLYPARSHLDPHKRG
jgi:hypothetical protein